MRSKRINLIRKEKKGVIAWLSPLAALALFAVFLFFVLVSSLQMFIANKNTQDLIAKINTENIELERNINS
ncbi:MAG: hypothetical protein HY072_04735, partial [Deltaproteobacteria bacterium]|nr:hypothetical protein [Deltaproteobacteria bacterium]